MKKKLTKQEDRRGWANSIAGTYLKPIFPKETIEAFIDEFVNSPDKEGQEEFSRLMRCLDKYGMEEFYWNCIK